MISQQSEACSVQVYVHAALLFLESMYLLVLPLDEDDWRVGVCLLHCSLTGLAS